MADLAASIAAAKKSGYSDADIAAYIAKDPSMGPKVAAARQHGYSDAEIVGHLAQPAPYTVVGEIKGAVDRLKGDWQTAMDPKTARLPARDLAATAPSAAAADRLGGDVLDVIVSPVKGAVTKYINKPIAKATGIREDDLNVLESTGLMALGARSPGPRNALAPARVAAPATRNALAERTAAFEQAGVRPTMAAVGGRAPAAIAKAAAENPLAGVRARPALQASINDTQEAAQRLAGKYGAPASRGATGEAVQQGVQDFNTRFSKRAEALYDPVFTRIDQAQSSAVAASQAAAEKQGALASASGGTFRAPPPPVINPTQTQAVLGELGGRVNAKGLSQIIVDPRLRSIAAAVESGKQDLRFGDLRALRSWVREAKSNPELRQGIDQAGLQRLEGALTQDISANAEQIAGPKAARQLRQADTFYRLGSQRIEGGLQTFVGKGSAPKAGESTYDIILRAASDRGGADTARLTALKKSLQPHEWGEVAATTIDRMGTPTAGVSEEGAFSVNRFVTNYGSLSPQGKDLLFGKGPLRAEMENLNRVAGMQKSVERASNVSKSGVSLQALGTVAGLANPGTSLPAAQFLGLLALSGEAMTNPAVVRWVVRSSQAAERGQAALSATARQIQAASAKDPALQGLATDVARIAATGGVASTATTQNSPARAGTPPE